MGVVGLLAHHDAVHHVPHVQAHLVAVLVAMDGHPLALALDDGGVAGHLMGRRTGVAAGLGHVGGRARRAARKPHRRQGACSRQASQEAAARQTMLCLFHVSSQ